MKQHKRKNGKITVQVIPEMTPHPGLGVPGEPGGPWSGIITEQNSPRRWEAMWAERLVELQTRGLCRPRADGRTRSGFRMVAVYLLHVVGKITHPNVWSPKFSEGQKAVRVATAITVCRNCPVISQCEAYASTHPAADGFVLAGQYYGTGRSSKKDANGKIINPGIKDIMDTWNTTVQGKTRKGRITKSFINSIKTRRAWNPYQKRYVDGTITEYSPHIQNIQSAVAELQNDTRPTVKGAALLQNTSQRTDDMITVGITESNQRRLRGTTPELAGEITEQVDYEDLADLYYSYFPKEM